MGAVHTFPLNKPITIGSGENEEKIEKLEYFEFTAGQMESLPYPLDSMAAQMELLSVATAQPMAVIRKLHPLDLVQAVAEANIFIASGRKDGEISSAP